MSLASTRVGATRDEGENSAAGKSASAEAQAIMACVTAGFAKLEKSLEKLAKAK